MFTTDRITSLFSRNRLGILFLCALCLGDSSCGHAEGATPIPISTVIKVVREYAREHQFVPGPQKAFFAQAAPAADELYDLDGPYPGHLAAIFARGDFGPFQLEECP